MPDSLEDWIKTFPGKDGLKFSLDRKRLYTIDELFSGYIPGDKGSWPNTYDQQAYHWYFDTKTQMPRPLSLTEAIAARLHDAEIQNGIDQFLAEGDEKAIGFMGGHTMGRGDDSYRQVAVMARTLRRAKKKIITGGGPGAMEAANLGAFLAPYLDDELDKALAILKGNDLTKDDCSHWIDAAAEVRSNLLKKSNGLLAESSNLGIPCWLYGDEPPNLFATAIGKYFYNSVREDGLVSLAGGGLVFAPGSAGTVQEVFQNATINYYAHKKVGSYPTTPMAFLGVNSWNPDMAGGDVEPRHVPVLPLLRKLAWDALPADHPFPEQIFVSDEPQEIVNFLLSKGAKALPGDTLAERLLTQRRAMVSR